MLPPLPAGYESRMPRYEEARELRSVGQDIHGRAALLTPMASDSWIKMRAAGERDGVNLQLISTFRSIARQTEILAAKLASGIAWAEILAVNAYPGFSEHHTGRAVDIGSPACPALAEQFADTPEFAWLQANAGQFRFALSYPPGNPSGIAYEPWHWCFT